MIRKTIEEHLEKELKLNRQGIKVLSLFFIDKVANYRKYDQNGHQINGEYAQIFEKEYEKLIQKPKLHKLLENSAYQDSRFIHSGYFSIDKRRQAKDTKGNSRDDEDTYNLIMRDKEKLLSFTPKVRFIFSHSALREGWDNPNVFQICTLKERGASNITPRQQIGRGLRLCVNQNGERVHGHQVNTLSVIANESWDKFVQELQTEIEKESGFKFGIAQETLFSNVVVERLNNTPVYLGQQKSQELYKAFVRLGYFDHTGRVQDHLKIHLDNQNVQIPPKFLEYGEYVEQQIVSLLRRISTKYEVKNGDHKKRIKPNQRILNSPEFKDLWDRVKYKTTFSVRFDTQSLIEKCIESWCRKEGSLSGVGMY